MAIDPEQEARWRAWMCAAQRGDAGAYQRLLRETLPFLRHIARRRLADLDDAEDAVQETLLCVHQVRGSYDPSRPFMPWLASIADRRSIDVARRRLRHRSREKAGDDESADETLTAIAANQDLEPEDSARTLGELLAELPPRQRQALEMTKLREMTVAEAAAASGQTPGAVKVNVHRAITSLRKKLGL